MFGLFEYPPLMDLRKTVEFILVQITRVCDIEKACLNVGDIFLAYDQKENRFWYPPLEEIRTGEWMTISFNKGNLYLQKTLSSQGIEAIKKYCSQVITNTWQYEKVLKETLIDPLTGLLNKCALQKRLEEEIARCSRCLGSFCVIFLDVNNLKTINDSYGHLIGDSVLKGVARTIRRSLRKSDIVARFGGDEFVVILPNTSSQQGKAVMNRLLNDVKRANMENMTVSVSAGLAWFPEDGCDCEHLINVADKRMYENKLCRR